MTTQGNNADSAAMTYIKQIQLQSNQGCLRDVVRSCSRLLPTTPQPRHTPCGDAASGMQSTSNQSLWHIPQQTVLVLSLLCGNAASGLQSISNRFMALQTQLW
jgi:hypothetical protein